MKKQKKYTLKDDFSLRHAMSRLLSIFLDIEQARREYIGQDTALAIYMMPLMSEAEERWLEIQGYLERLIEKHEEGNDS